MPTALTELSRQFPAADPPRKRWTRAECVALEASGVWAQQHLELIGGDLISKMGKKRAHTNVLIVVQAWLVRVFGEQYVNPETPIDVAPEDNPTNEPEPDLIVLSRPSREFRSANPPPADIRLVVEISDSTLSFDLTTKANLNARARILEYWVVDIPSRRIIVHRDPRDGRYGSVTAYTSQEGVSPLASRDHEFLVETAFSE